MPNECPGQGLFRAGLVRYVAGYELPIMTKAHRAAA